MLGSFAADVASYCVLYANLCVMHGMHHWVAVHGWRIHLKLGAEVNLAQSHVPRRAAVFESRQMASVGEGTGQWQCAAHHEDANQWQLCVTCEVYSNTAHDCSEADNIDVNLQAQATNNHKTLKSVGEQRDLTLWL